MLRRKNLKLVQWLWKFLGRYFRWNDYYSFARNLVFVLCNNRINYIFNLLYYMRRKLVLLLLNMMGRMFIYLIKWDFKMTLTAVMYKHILISNKVKSWIEVSYWTTWSLKGTRKLKKHKATIMVLMLKKMFSCLRTDKLMVLSSGKACTKWRNIKEERCCWHRWWWKQFGYQFWWWLTRSNFISSSPTHSGMLEKLLQ